VNRVRAADDFKAIRLRLEELQRDRAQSYAGAAAKSPRPESDAPRKPSAPADKRYPPIRRHPGSI
jgi:hypothetical protein